MTHGLLTFDLDNTLWETNPVIIAAEQACYDWLEQHAAPVCEQYSLLDLRQIRVQLVKQDPSLGHRLTQLRHQSLYQALRTVDYSTEQSTTLADGAMAAFMYARNDVALYDGVLPALQQMHQHYVLTAISNGNSDLCQIGIDHLFSDHFQAETSDAPKPDATMFRQALAAANSTPEQTIHIGDHPLQDVAAAARLGIKTIWYSADSDWQSAIEPYLANDPWAKEYQPDAIVDGWPHLLIEVNRLLPIR